MRMKSCFMSAITEAGLAASDDPSSVWFSGSSWLKGLHFWLVFLDILGLLFAERFRKATLSWQRRILSIKLSKDQEITDKKSWLTNSNGGVGHGT